MARKKIRKYISEKQQWMNVGYDKAVSDFNREQLYKGLTLGTIATTALFTLIMSLA